MPSTEMFEANQGQNSDLGRPARELSGTISIPISSMPAPATTAGATSSVRAIVPPPRAGPLHRASTLILLRGGPRSKVLRLSLAPPGATATGASGSAADAPPGGPRPGSDRAGDGRRRSAE